MISQSFLRNQGWISFTPVKLSADLLSTQVQKALAGEEVHVEAWKSMTRYSGYQSTDDVVTWWSAPAVGETVSDAQI